MEEKAKPTLLQLSAKPHYSYTALNTYLTVCQLQFYYRYVEKAEQERTSAALPFGTSFHQVLSEQAQAAKNGRLLASSEMKDAFNAYFTIGCKAAGNIVFKGDESIDTLTETAGRMFDMMNRNWIDYYNIRSVAEPFSVDVPGLSKPVIGEFDMVVTESLPFNEEGQTERPVIVDFKTAARQWPEDKAAKDLQATIFSYAYSRNQCETPSFRFDVITTAKQPTVKRFTTERGEGDFKRMVKLFQTADRGIAAGVFMPSDTCFSCPDCPYADRCRRWHLDTRN